MNTCEEYTPTPSRIAEYKLTLRAGKIVFPSISSLEKAKSTIASDGEWKTVLSIQEATLGALMQWLEDLMPGRFRINGVYSWCEEEFRVMRNFKGVVIYFCDIVDAVMLKLRWSEFSA